MARRRDGGSRRVRRRGLCHDIADYGNDYSGDGDSEGDNGLEYEKRDTILDDTLFGFFSEEAVKSLKRNFSDFCRNVSTSNKPLLIGSSVSCTIATEKPDANACKLKKLLAAHMMFCIKGLAGSGACLSEKFRICCSATISSRYVYNLAILNYYIILACLLPYVVYLIQTF